jgi:cation diffusion facilitator family transporter
MITGEKQASTRQAVIAGGIDTIITLGALLAAQSSVLLADFLKTLLEFVAVLLGWLAIRRIQEGSRSHFEYGLDKLEGLSSLLIGSLMVAIVLIITVNAVINILQPGHIAGIGVWVSMVTQVLYGIINGKLCLRNRALARGGRSPIVESQARLFFAKAAGNAFILASLGTSVFLRDRAWSVYIDPVASFVIAGTILMSAIGVFSASVGDLLDRTLEEADQMRLLRVLASQFDDYDAFFGTRTRRAGGREFIEVFLGFDDVKTVRIIQESMDRVRHAIEREFPEASVVIVLSNKDVSMF